MAEISELQNLLDKLRAQQGPRGATYAGRVLGPQDTPESVMQRIPLGEVESAGRVMQAPADLQAAMSLPVILGRFWQTLRGRFGEEVASEILKQSGFNPRDVPQGSMPMYDKLPRGGRSFQTAEDIARQRAGEELPKLGESLPPFRGK